MRKTNLVLGKVCCQADLFFDRFTGKFSNYHPTHPRATLGALNSKYLEVCRYWFQENVNNKIFRLQGCRQANQIVGLLEKGRYYIWNWGIFFTRSKEFSGGEKLASNRDIFHYIAVPTRIKRLWTNKQIKNSIETQATFFHDVKVKVSYWPLKKLYPHYLPLLYAVILFISFVAVLIFVLLSLQLDPQELSSPTETCVVIIIMIRYKLSSLINEVLYVRIYRDFPVPIPIGMSVSQSGTSLSTLESERPLTIV